MRPAKRASKKAEMVNIDKKAQHEPDTILIPPLPRRDNDYAKKVLEDINDTLWRVAGGLDVIGMVEIRNSQSTWRSGQCLSETGAINGLVRLLAAQVLEARSKLTEAKMALGFIKMVD